MARSRLSGSKRLRAARDAYAIATTVSSPPVVSVVRRARPSQALVLVEDRRTFYPTAPALRPALSFSRKSHARVVAKQNPRFNQPSQTKAILAFAEPKKVLVCVRRKRRKEVLHAKGVAGRRGLRRPHRNNWSGIRCV